MAVRRLRNRRRGVVRIRARPGGRAVVLEGQTDRGRLKIVELTLTGRPEERGKEARAEHERQGKDKEDHGHGKASGGTDCGARSRRGLRTWSENSARASTDAELIGIRIAARSGWMCPPAARTTNEAL